MAVQPTPSTTEDLDFPGHRASSGSRTDWLSGRRDSARLPGNADATLKHFKVVGATVNVEQLVDECAALLEEKAGPHLQSFCNSMARCECRSCTPL